MEFNLKAQNIGTTLSEGPYTFAIAHQFEVPDDTLLQKRGQLYLIMSISTGNVAFNLGAAGKLFIDEVQEDYYRNTDDTPLHAIEKSLNRAYKNLLNTKDQDENITLNHPDVNTKISIATILVWNSVLYASAIGNPAVYLIRGTGIRNLYYANNPSEIWTSSSILADADVILIGTETFSNEFPPEEISKNMGGLTRTIANNPKKDLIAATLIKVESKESVKPSKKLAKIKPVNVRYTVTNQLGNVRQYLSANTPLSERYKTYQSKKIAPVSSISSLSGNANSSLEISGKSSSKRISKLNQSRRVKYRFGAGILMLALFIGINYKVLTAAKTTDLKEDIKSQIASTLNSENSEDASNIKGVESTPSLHPVFTNLTYTSANFLPIDMTSNRLDKVYLISNNSLYELDVETKEPREIYKEFERAQHIECDTKLANSKAKQLCYIVSDTYLYVLDPQNSDNIDKYNLSLSNLVDIYPYNGGVYMLTDNNIYFLRLLADTPEKWLKEGTSLPENVKAIYVNNDVYILADRQVYKYSRGLQDITYQLKDNSQLINPINMEISGNKIFILDAADGNDKYIAEYDLRTGNFLNKTVLADRTDNESVLMFSISGNPTNKIIYKKGNYLYQVENAEVNP